VLPACGGGAPLLHPAHVLTPGTVSFGAGASGRAMIRGPAAGAEAEQLERVAVAPGVAPWVGGRVGIRGSNEGGLTYTGRAVRADIRHAFELGAPALSVGLGASFVFARPGLDANEGQRDVKGGGVDIPILFGARSRSDLYAIWIGPRFGVELLGGRLRPPSEVDPSGEIGDAREVDAFVLSPSLVAGLRAGFRHLHVALEIDAAYHRVSADYDGRSFDIDQVTLTPGGAVVITF
jgi:hypothetical protein